MHSPSAMTAKMLLLSVSAVILTALACTRPTLDSLDENIKPAAPAAPAGPEESGLSPVYAINAPGGDGSSPPYDSGVLSPFGTGYPYLFVLNQPPQAESPVTFRFEARADLDALGEAVHLVVNKSWVATMFSSGTQNCATPPSSQSMTIPAAQFNNLLALQNGDAEIQILPIGPVDPWECGTSTYVSYIRLRVEYCGGPDCNGNGTPDNCEIAGNASLDKNKNGIPDECELKIDSITPAVGMVHGGTTVTIHGKGFGSGAAVLFGQNAASSVTIFTPEVMTAVTPPGPLGEVDVKVSAVIGGVGLSSTKPAGYKYVPVIVDPGIDSDGDGLTDFQELMGYEIWVDQFGLGFGVDKFGNVTRRFSYSDPYKVDTDGDGLTDYEEFLIRSDASMKDTDGDGWSDYKEWVEEWTSPTTVDSDGDARGPSGTAPPNAALFDSAEQTKVFDKNGKLLYGGTSPIYDDTDGDGLTDFEEWGHPLRSQLVAEVPLLEVQFVGGLTFQLDISLEDGTTLTEGTQNSLTQSSSSSQSNTNETTWENSLTFTEKLTVGVEKKFGAEPGVTLKAELGFEASQGFTEGGSTSWTKESTQATESGFVKVQEAAKTQATTVSGGTITTAIRIANKGPVAFQLKNLVISALIIDNQARDSFRPLTAIKPDFLGDGLTLAAYGTTGPLPISTDLDAVSAPVMFDLMANPTALILDVATFDLVNQDGLSYAFLNDVTNARTATLIIDLGLDRPIETYRVATEVKRNSDGSPAGVTIKEVLEQVLRIPYETKPRTGSTEPDYPNGVKVLTKVRDREMAFPDPNDASLDPNVPVAFWAIIGNFDAAEFPASAQTNFQDIILRAGQTIALVYTEDRDGDGVFKREEFMYGTSDLDPDSDDDGLTDYEEIREGWDVILPNKPIKRVYPSPLSPNIDGDLLDDVQERALGLDPRNPDTDGDGLIDGIDNCPLDPVNIPPDIDLQKIDDVSGSEVTLTGTVFESLTEGTTRCDADSILEIEIDWGDGSDPDYVPNPINALSVNVNVSHTYAILMPNGVITVTATDKRGAKAVKTFAVDITFPLGGMIAHYPFNNQPGVVSYADATGNGYNGTGSNSTQQTSTSSRHGNTNRALCLPQDHVIDGQPPAGVLLPHIPVPDPTTGEMTLAVWHLPSKGKGLILGERNFCGLFVTDTNQLAFTVRDPDLPANNPGSYFTVTDPNPLCSAASCELTGSPAECNSASNAGNWVFVAATVHFDGTKSVLRLYRASFTDFGTAAVVMVAEANGPAKLLADPLPALGWQISASHPAFGPVPAADTAGDNPLEGRVDDIRIYDRELKLVELNALLNEPEYNP